MLGLLVFERFKVSKFQRLLPAERPPSPWSCEIKEFRENLELIYGLQ